MENVDGKIIFSSIQEIVDPSHTALVVWDVQNMLVNRVFNKEQLIGTLTSIIKAARTFKVPVFFSQIKYLPIRYDAPARIYARKYIYRKLANFPIAITEDDLALAIKPDKDEIIIGKHTASIFIGTNFEVMTRNSGISTIIFTGIATELGVESSARDALNRDFYPVVISDAVSSFDEDPLTLH
jgi:nicotinamidase-related amidase